MSSSVTAVRPFRAMSSRRAAQTAERRVHLRVGIIWGLLVLNVLTFTPKQSVLPIPSSVGKAITQGALQLALLMALSVNRRLVVRPNIFLCLVSLLVLGAAIPTMQVPHVSAIYRTVRLAEFIAVLFLLSPWWGRRDLLLVRCHLAAMSAVLGSVLLGLLVSPGHARINGRLSGAIWPIPATQVAHYSAVTIGIVVVLWLSGYVNGRITLLVFVVAGAILLLTHTRTALVGLVAGILVAGLSLIVAKARVRRLFAIAGAVAAIAIMTLSSVIVSWLARGQGTQQLIDLTGRTQVWSMIVNFPRDKLQEFFGFGLSYTSFNGLAIDSNWLASYMAQGLYGVVVCMMELLFLFVTAYFQPRGVQRALALFLLTYCLVASFTEVGFTDASPYLLELTLSASLLVPTIGGRSRYQVRRHGPATRPA
jgi:hypothetical protein